MIIIVMIFEILKNSKKKSNKGYEKVKNPYVNKIFE